MALYKKKIGIFALMLLAFAAIASVSVPRGLSANPSFHPANSMWIESDISELNVSQISVGYKFNITVWLNLSVESYSWQFKIYYNNTYLNITRAAYTAGATSEFFAGHSTVPAAPNIDYVQGYIMHGETLIGSDSRAPGCGNLTWIEFEVIDLPPVCQSLNFTFDPGRTFVLDPNLSEVPIDSISLGIHAIDEFSVIWLMIVFSAVASAAVITAKKHLSLKAPKNL